MPTPRPQDLETYYDPAYKRTRQRLKKGLVKVGDSTFLLRAATAAPVDVVAVEKKLSATPRPQSKGFDPGLTLALLPYMAGLAEEEKQWTKKIGALRDEFNALRLRIGMTESEVRAVLPTKPLDAGDVAAGTYKIYGKEMHEGGLFPLVFANILVLFKDGRATTIYAVPAGPEWRKDLAHMFSDLPAR